MNSELASLFKTARMIIFDYFNSSEDALYNKHGNNNANEAKMYLYYILHYEYNISISKIAKLSYKTERNIKQCVSNMKYRICNIKKYSETYKYLIDKIETPNT